MGMLELVYILDVYFYWISYTYFYLICPNGIREAVNMNFKLLDKHWIKIMETIGVIVAILIALKEYKIL